MVNHFLHGLDLINIILQGRSEVESLPLGQAFDLLQAEVMHKVRVIVGLASGWLEDVLSSLPVTVDIIILRDVGGCVKDRVMDSHKYVI